MGNNIITALNSTSFIPLNDPKQETIIRRINCNEGSPDITFATPKIAIETNWQVLDQPYGSDHYPIKLIIRDKNNIKKIVLDKN